MRWAAGACLVLHEREELLAFWLSPVLDVGSFTCKKHGRYTE